HCAPAHLSRNPLRVRMPRSAEHRGSCQGDTLMTRSLVSARAGALLAIAAAIAGAPFAHAQSRTSPRYEADVSWPKPLPHRWVLGGLGGTCVDARDHVFILNRQDVLDGELNTGRL